MLLRLSVRDVLGCKDVIVEADGRATVGDLTGVLTDSGAARLWRIGAFGGVELAAPVELGRSGLLDGEELIVVEASGGAPGSAPARWRLEILSGPDAGETRLLPDGVLSIGRGDSAFIQLSDGEMSRDHATLTVTMDGVVISNNASLNGVFVAGKRLSSPVLLGPAAGFRLGASTMRVTGPLGSHDEHASDGRGGLLIDRVPSRRVAFRSSRVELPAEPIRLERRGFPWIPALLPLLLAGGMFAFTREPTFLLFALLSPLTAVATSWSDRRITRKRERAAQNKYAAERAMAKDACAVAIVAERRWLDEAYLRGSECVSIAELRGPRLWERSADDVDFLALRLGSGDVAASVEVTAAKGGLADHAIVSNAAIHVQLTSDRVLGLAGADSDLAPLVRSLVIQLATLHSSDDVRIVLLSEGARESEWGYLRWLPHVWNDATRRVQIARNAEQISTLVEDLLVICAANRDAGDGQYQKHVVIMDGASLLRRRSDVAALLRQGPDGGVYTIALDEHERRLPEECSSTVGVAGASVHLHNRLSKVSRAGVADRIGLAAAQRAARSLASVRRISGQREDVALPLRLRFSDLIGEQISADGMIRRWSTAGDGVSNAPVGRSARGIYYIDLVESGPHALIGGTTGSGKSEFVRSWMSALAYLNPPDVLTFLFIEYKGLSAFQKLQHLPHCVGTITNLDRTLTVRALQSLDAEKKRRQKLFDQAAVVDIRDYQIARRADPGLPEIPRLLIVIDEFAEMKQHLPDFMEELISIARVGRSLGIHLILATQQVGSAVSPQIAGNASVRISLRAKSRDDSYAVIDSALATQIPASAPGRAVAITGTSTAPEMFQSAWVRAPAEDGNRPPVVVNSWQWDEFGEMYQSTGGREALMNTDLDELINAACAAAESLGIGAPRRPFTPPLPSLIRLSDVVTPEGEGLAGMVRRRGPVIGKRDDVIAQIQDQYAIPLLDGHAAIIGSLRTGRTTTLRTCVGSWASEVPPSMLHVHAIDSTRALASLSALPHVGTVVDPEDVRARRLLITLAGEVRSRLEMLSRLGLGDLVELWAQPGTESPVPWILLLIDRFEDVTQHFEGADAGEALERILSQGPAAGITVLAAGDDTLTRNRWLKRFPTRLVLRTTGGMDSTAAGLPPRLTVSNLPDGRGYESDQGAAVQVAVLGTDSSLSAQNSAVRALGEHLAIRWAVDSGSTPVRFKELPDDVVASGLPLPLVAGAITLGLGGDTATPVEIGPDRLPLLVVGKRGTGRTTALRRVAESWTARGISTYIVAGMGSALVSNPVPGAILGLEAASDQDWVHLLADTAVGVIIDDIDRDDLPDGLVQAMRTGLTACLIAASTSPVPMSPTPVAMLHRRGSLLFLCPPDRITAGFYDLKIEASACFARPAGRGVLFYLDESAVVQVGR